ncbi:Ig-like domain-containing protein [Terriglobus albidus]|uniref:Ig-like domain-containing protein n=1 Tax=Terriglobus albidus TaxID=1592106 RepID=UPI0021E081D1|nr:Ig-like domain-containing protein [Terriglobus albidus]
MTSDLKIRGSFAIAAALLFAVICVVLVAPLLRGFTTVPRVVVASPYAGEVGVEPQEPITLAFNKPMSPETILPGTFSLRDEQGRSIPATVSYDDATNKAVLTPLAALSQGSTYEVTLRGGKQGLLDQHNRSLAGDMKWRFTTGVAAAGSPEQGPDGPILLVTSKANGFSQYYAEILRNEGLNEFDVEDITQLSAQELASHDIVLLGEMPVDTSQIQILAGWVRSGGTLIAMRPSRKLAESFGFNPPTSEADKAVQHGGYLRINSKTPAGAGLIQQAIQFHGDADLFTADKTTVFATLYTDAKTATQFPAVSSVTLGAGNVIVFSYDLAKSVVYTRQGNPEWSAHERDGIPPIRSDDLFYGANEKDPQPDWVAREVIAIPQADIQQRLLANLIITFNANKTPLPHFWYLPRGLKAVIVMTGDDHGHGGTAGRFRNYQRKSASNCSLEKWECIRATSHIFVGSISSKQADDFVKQGFEIGLHVYTACTDWPAHQVRESDGVVRREIDREFVNDLYLQQLQGFAAKYPNVPPPVSNRTDCITWGDYDTQPQVELNHRIRLDTNYYYWPPKWVKDTPGLFTGSGFPMRFARRDGSVIDVYQAATQMTDESKQSYPFTIDTLLANALGSEEYFGVFTANMHNDEVKSPGADAIISSAQKHHVPIITAAQLLKWLDGRNASRFRDLKWSNCQLSFSIDVGIGGSGIEAMLPIHSSAGDLTTISLNGATVQWQKRTVAGLSYAVVQAAPGTFQVNYGHSAANWIASR